MHSLAVSAREERAAFDAAIEQIRADAIAVTAPLNWILSVRMADDGVVECSGALWWEETKRNLERHDRLWATWDPDSWRRFPK